MGCLISIAWLIPVILIIGFAAYNLPLFIILIGAAFFIIGSALVWGD